MRIGHRCGRVVVRILLPSFRKDSTFSPRTSRTRLVYGRISTSTTVGYRMLVYTINIIINITNIIISMIIIKTTTRFASDGAGRDAVE